jgi:hypothetical protein
MFQYALGRNLSLLHNAPFKIDSSYLRAANQSGRGFLLDNFKTVLDEATPAEINKYRSKFQKILDRIRPESKKKKISDISQSAKIFYKNILNRSDGYFDGHWNSEKYFEDNQETIRKDFQLKKPLGQEALKMDEMISSQKNSVGLHIRRGDYVTIQKVASTLGVLPLSYYNEAVGLILNKFSNATFFIFSDDIGWTKENFPKNYPLTFVSRPEITECEEMILMSKCKHNIIANSTFSWWGAWLNSNPNKIVIAPKKWHRKEKLNSSDIIPNKWIQI